MKLQPDRFEAQSVTAYGPGWVAINGEKRTQSVIMTSDGARLDWPAQCFEQLQATHFEALAELDVELIILGSGEKLRFVPPAWLSPLMAHRIGVETMTTAAACRTYNILAGEGRTVAAALLIEAIDLHPDGA